MGDRVREQTSRDVWRAHQGYSGAYLLNVSLACYFGVTAILDPARFQAATYDPLRDTFGIAGWGVLLLYGAALAACAWASIRTITRVFWWGAVLYMVFAGWFAAGLGDPRASPWSLFFVWLAVWQLTQRSAYMRHEA